MFFAMGIPWLAETLSYGLEWYHGPETVRYITTIFSIINALQGLILFCVIVFDSSTINKIKQKYGGGSPKRKMSLAPSTTRTSRFIVPETTTRQISKSISEKFLHKFFANASNNVDLESRRRRQSSRNQNGMELKQITPIEIE
jgi:membrane-bound lytic murein transglycosylase B